MESRFLEVDKVTKRFGTVNVLRGMSLHIPKGGILALMGPSGSGKSTLLNCIGGLESIDSGSIRLGGRALHDLDREAWTELRRRSISSVFQFFHLLPTLTVSENIELPLQLIQIPAKERRARIDRILEEVGLTDRRQAWPDDLSGGEMQRVALARSIVTEPDLLLADEPTGSLDQKNGQLVLDLIRELANAHGTTVLVVTHDASVAANCDQTLHMQDGKECPSHASIA